MEKKSSRRARRLSDDVAVSAPDVPKLRKLLGR
jgi:ribosomal protein L35